LSLYSRDAVNIIFRGGDNGHDCTIRALNVDTAGVSVGTTVAMSSRVDDLIAMGITMQTAAIEDLPVFVIDGDHLEKLLSVTLSPASCTFPSF